MNKAWILAAAVVVVLLVVAVAMLARMGAKASTNVAGPQTVGTDASQYYAAGLGASCALTSKKSGKVKVTFTGEATGETGTLELTLAAGTPPPPTMGTPLQNPPYPGGMVTGWLTLQIEKGKATPFQFEITVVMMPKVAHWFDLGLKARPGPAMIQKITFKAAEV